MRKIILILSLSLISNYTQSQQRRVIDSLIKITINSKVDAIKMDSYEKLINIYWNINNDTAKVYNEKFRNLAIKVNDKSCILSSKIYEAVYYDSKDDNIKAKNFFDSSYNDIKNEKNCDKTKLFALYHYNYGNFCMKMKQKDLAIDNYKKGIEYYRKLKNYKNVARIKLNIGFIYGNKNEFSKSIEIYQSAIPDLKKAKDWLGLSAVYGRIGYNYGVLKMHEKAIEYHKLGLIIDNKNDLINNKAYALYNIATEYADMNQFQKAISYFNESKPIFIKLEDDYMSLCVELSLILIEIKNGNINTSLSKLLDIESKNIAIYENQIVLFHSIGTCYYKLKKYNLSESYLEKALELSKLNNYPNKILEISHDYINSRLKSNNDYKSFESMKMFDSLNKIKNENDNKIAFFNLDKKYQTVEKESQIKTQQLQIEKEKTNKYLAFGGIGFLLLLSGGGYFWFKNKQKQRELLNQNTLLSLQQNLNAMELSNLNKQLDPHEIKNLLASISPEIQEKAPDSYKKMLKLFNLTKASLNSNSITESIENQLQQINDFMSLEKSMLATPLEYTVENKIENTQTQIPRLLLKNLVENSIKHGIKGKENGGSINVILQENNGFINIEVDDTGKGRKHAISLDSGIGTTTYQKLFATLNHKNKENATFEIIDKEQGTKVEVKIPIDYKYS